MAWKTFDEHRDNDVLGINDEKLKKLILDIYDCRDKISKLLQDAEYVAQSTKTFYKTEDGEMFRSRFKKFSSNFPVVLSNVKSYGLDLEKVLFEYKQTDDKSVDIFEKEW